MSDMGGHGEAREGWLEGLARVAAAWAELPARRAGVLPVDEGRAAATLAAGWDLLAFSPTGELLVELLEAAGARVELVQGVPATWGRGRRRGRGRGGATAGGEARGVGGALGGGPQREGGEGVGDGTPIPRATSHGPTAAAWGAPPGRRVAAMGVVPGPDGAMVRASCALVLRLPQQALDRADRVAWILAFHGAMHAAERRSLPSPPRLAASLEGLFAAVGAPDRVGDQVSWALGVAGGAAGELGLDPACLELGLEPTCAGADDPYSGH